MLKNFPPDLSQKGDFQDIPLWRSFNLGMLSYIRGNYGGIIIVPMTVTNRQYYDEMIDALAQKYNLHHYILYAKRKTIEKTPEKTLESKNRWAFQQIDRCLNAFDAVIPGEQIHTDRLTIAETAEEVARKF